MPSNVSKLWFQSNNFDESIRPRPDTLSWKNLKLNSTRIDDFPSESKYTRYRHHHTKNALNIDRVRTLNSSSYASVDSISNSLSSEYQEQGRRPTNLKTRRERDNRSKSLKSKQVLHNSHGSSFSRDDNWILRRTEEKKSPTSSPHHSSSRRPHVSKIFTTVEHEKSRDEHPFYQNNKNLQIKYNTLYKDTSAPSRRHMVDIQVAPQTPSKGKQLKVSDESNKYTIQIGSPSMTIEGVTLHKPNHITQV